jgi:hypothetical protein
MTPFAVLFAALSLCMSMPASTTNDEPDVRRAIICAWADDATGPTPAHLPNRSGPLPER